MRMSEEWVIPVLNFAPFLLHFTFSNQKKRESKGKEKKKEPFHTALLYDNNTLQNLVPTTSLFTPQISYLYSTTTGLKKSMLMMQ